MTWLVQISGRDPETDSFSPDGAIIQFFVSNEDEILAVFKRISLFLGTVSQFQNAIIQTYELPDMLLISFALSILSVIPKLIFFWYQFNLEHLLCKTSLTLMSMCPYKNNDYSLSQSRSFDQ